MSRLSHVQAVVYDKPWFIRPDSLATIEGIVRLHAEGGSLSRDEIRARVEMATAAAGPRGGARTVGAIGVIPVYGPIMPRANLMTEYSGGATITGIQAAFREALSDESIGTILFDVDSPGGYTDGVDELAQEIREADRQGKAIVAHSHYMMASAAYYLMSGCDEIVASPSSEVGWIGCVYVHQEFSKMNEIVGITTTVIRNPAGKYGGNQYEPLSDKALTELTDLVDERAGQFHGAVSKGRRIPAATVKADFGQGGGMTAAKAKAAGLVDRVESFDQTVRRLASGKGPLPRGTSGTAAPAGVGAELQRDLNEGGTLAGDDPDAASSGEPAAPPRDTEAAAALALARAQADR